jgi:hypothetical protein
MAEPLTLRAEPSYATGTYDAAPATRRSYDQGGGDLNLVANNLAQQLTGASEGAPRQGWSEYAQPEEPAYGNARTGYTSAAAAGASTALHLEELARAMDRRTAEELWDRFCAGEQGILGRHLYNAAGQVTFDEITRRYSQDQDFRATVDRYIADFERFLSDADQTDPEGRIARHHITSETGRVYLLLAHASGRLR